MQPTNTSLGDHTSQCFGNALSLTWTDWAKPSSSVPNMQGRECFTCCVVRVPISGFSFKMLKFLFEFRHGPGSDGRSVSSGSGSRGASRTPSPFGLPPSSSVSSSTSSAIPSLAHGATGFCGGGSAAQMLAEKGGVGPKTALALPASVKQGIPHSESYSRKVFVGGLPPDIDQGQSASGC